MLKVRAIAVGQQTYSGYFDHKRRVPGEEFELHSAKQFSKRWMEPIGWKPEGFVPQAPPVVKKEEADVPEVNAPSGARASDGLAI